MRTLDSVCVCVCWPNGTLLVPACSIDIAMGFDISKRSGVSGEMLITGHPALHTFLPEISHYVSTIKGLACSGPTPDKANVGYRVLRGDGSTLYDVSFDAYSDAVVDKVMTLPLGEPTYFNTALLKSFQEKFNQSRAGVKVSPTGLCTKLIHI